MRSLRAKGVPGTSYALFWADPIRYGDVMSNCEPIFGQGWTSADCGKRAFNVWLKSAFQNRKEDDSRKGAKTPSDR